MRVRVAQAQAQEGKRPLQLPPAAVHCFFQISVEPTFLPSLPIAITLVQFVMTSAPAPGLSHPFSSLHTQLTSRAASGKSCVPPITQFTPL